jgi:hypothetical protein
MPPRRNPVTGPNVLEIRSPEGNVQLKSVDIPMYETTPMGSQVMDAIVQLVSALDRDRVAK